MGRYWVILVLLIFTLLIFGCCGAVSTPTGNINNAPQGASPIKTYQCPDGLIVTDLSQCPKTPSPNATTTYTCPDGTNVTNLSQCQSCPSTCDDNNSCTTDYCNASTNFECVHTPITGFTPSCSGGAGLCSRHICSNGSCITEPVVGCSNEINSTYSNGLVALLYDNDVLIAINATPVNCNCVETGNSYPSNPCQGSTQEVEKGWKCVSFMFAFDNDAKQPQSVDVSKFNFIDNNQNEFTGSFYEYNSIVKQLNSYPDVTNVYLEPTQMTIGMFLVKIPESSRIATITYQNSSSEIKAVFILPNNAMVTWQSVWG